MRIALFFGSFNPLHWGHIAIGGYILNNCAIDEIQYILSPHNPLKNSSDLNDATERLRDLTERIDNEFHDKRVKVSDIEFTLPKPLYTINTLRFLKEHNPENDYILVMGADNLNIIEKWYKWREILREFEVWVYPRAPYNAEELVRKYNAMDPEYRISAIDAPLYDISSTQIRENRI